MADYRTCSICNETKKIQDFVIGKGCVDGRRTYCKSCKNKKQREDYQLKMTNEIEKNKKRESSRKSANKFYHTHKKDLKFRITRNLRERLYKSLKSNKKTDKTFDLIDCSYKFFRQWIEEQFYGNMSWENYGSVWHIDHILPCSAFNLEHSEEQEICFHYTNLQPLLAVDNLKKQNKII